MSLAWDISFVFGLLQIPHMTQKTFEGQCRDGSYRILRLWAVAQQLQSTSIVFSALLG
jgi:hypothetical protein